MVKWIGSPNFDTDRKKIDRIVIHWMAGTLAGTDAQFQKTSPGTSAHYGVEDKTVHQYVKEENVAYHAGNYPMNQRSIGIEHSAAPDRPASDATYQTAAKLILEISKRHSIPLDRTHVIKHSEVKATQCPGTMDLDRLIRMAKELDTPTPAPAPQGPVTVQFGASTAVQNVYRALCGVEPSADEVAYKVKEITEGKPLSSVIEDIIRGDVRFKERWIPQPVQPAITPRQEAILAFFKSLGIG